MQRAVKFLFIATPPLRFDCMARAVRDCSCAVGHLRPWTQLDKQLGEKMLPWLLIVIIWACAVCQAAGQGLLPAHELQFGASNTLTQLQQQYKNSQSWKRAYKQKPRAACGTSGSSASLCAAQGTSTTEAHAQLYLATSPQAYYSISSSGTQLVAPAQDQAECLHCLCCGSSSRDSHGSSPAG